MTGTSLLLATRWPGLLEWATSASVVSGRVLGTVSGRAEEGGGGWRKADPSETERRPVLRSAERDGSAGVRGAQKEFSTVRGRKETL